MINDKHDDEATECFGCFGNSDTEMKEHITAHHCHFCKHLRLQSCSRMFGKVLESMNMTCVHHGVYMLQRQLRALANDFFLAFLSMERPATYLQQCDVETVTPRVRKINVCFNSKQSPDFASTASFIQKVKYWHNRRGFHFRIFPSSTKITDCQAIVSSLLKIINTTLL